LKSSAIMAEPKDQMTAQSTGVRWADTPTLVIKGAIHVFVFNCFVQSAIEQGRITPSTLGDETTIGTGGSGVTFRGHYTSAELVTVAKNNVLMAFGTTSLATDKAMDATFGAKNPDDTTELGAARAIVYQIRCAYAHDPLNPVWKPKPDKYRHIYRLTVEVPHTSGPPLHRTIELNPTLLNGRYFNIGDIGGLGGYLALLQYCRKKVETHPLGNSKYVPSEEP